MEEICPDCGAVQPPAGGEDCHRCGVRLPAPHETIEAEFVRQSAETLETLECAEVWE